MPEKKRSKVVHSRPQGNILTHDNFTTNSAASQIAPTGGKFWMAVQKSAEASPLRPSEIETGDVAAPAGTAPGFRHFRGTPRPSQRFRASGVDPLDSPGHQPK